MDVSVVVPTCNRAERLARLLEALERQDHPVDRFEVIVVDDASTDATPEVIEAAMTRSALRLRPLRMSRNGGPAPARNRGWRAAAADVVAFVDDDCTPDPGWVGAMAAAFADDDRLGVVQGHTSDSPGPVSPWTVSRTVSGPTPWFEGCNIAYRRAALEATGGFDEVIGWYGEDTAAAWKVLDAGWRSGFAGAAVVEHDLEERGVGWRIRHGWLEGNLVELAGRHPGLRAQAFRRGRIVRPESLTLPLALVGLVAARRHPALAVLAVPYLGRDRALLRRPVDLVSFTLVDLAALAGHLRGSLRARIVVV